MKATVACALLFGALLAGCAASTPVTPAASASASPAPAAEASAEPDKRHAVL